MISLGESTHLFLHLLLMSRLFLKCHKNLYTREEKKILIKRNELRIVVMEGK